MAMLENSVGPDERGCGGLRGFKVQRRPRQELPPPQTAGQELSVTSVIKEPGERLGYSRSKNRKGLTDEEKGPSQYMCKGVL